MPREAIYNSRRLVKRASIEIAEWISAFAGMTAEKVRDSRRNKF
jgi:hypothetical protein